VASKEGRAGEGTGRGRGNDPSCAPQDEKKQRQKKLVTSASAPLMVGNPAKAMKSRRRSHEREGEHHDDDLLASQALTLAMVQSPSTRPFQMNVTKYLDHRFHIFETLVEKTLNSLCIELRLPPHPPHSSAPSAATPSSRPSPLLLLSRSSPLLSSSPWTGGRTGADEGHTHHPRSPGKPPGRSGASSGYVIESIHPESNAYRQDILRRHDEVLEVNGLSCVGLGFEELMDLIQRDRDQFVLLLIRRRRRSGAAAAGGGWEVGDDDR
jgi:hypothetical protein